MAIKRHDINSIIYSQPTLGGRSEFEYVIEKGKLLLRFGKMVNFLDVKEDWVIDVKERIQKLKKEEHPKYKTQTSLYNKNKWDKCPNNIICPYVACLIINQKYKL